MSCDDSRFLSVISNYSEVQFSNEKKKEKKKERKKQDNVRLQYRLCYMLTGDKMSIRWVGTQQAVRCPGYYKSWVERETGGIVCRLECTQLQGRLRLMI